MVSFFHSSSLSVFRSAGITAAVCSISTVLHAKQLLSSPLFEKLTLTDCIINIFRLRLVLHPAYGSWRIKPHGQVPSVARRPDQTSQELGSRTAEEEINIITGTLSERRPDFPQEMNWIKKFAAYAHEFSWRRRSCLSAVFWKRFSGPCVTNRKSD
ncbi:uncharacterized [Tachysurus ichikawai]